MLRRSLSLLTVVAVVLLACNLAAAPAQEKTQTWTGWISDSSCGAKGANADHKACATKCVSEKGAKWAFVNTADKKVLIIHNQDAVHPEKDLGQEVKVTGHLTEDGTLHIDSIAPTG